jgi:putative restriction endonuclease
MRGYVANTDFEWYRYLSSRADLDEVNFWQPSGSRGFRAIPPGAPFLFKLKKPQYAICGYGFLGHTSILPAWLAWETFEEMNGAETFQEMTQRIEKYRRGRPSPKKEYDIGCLMIQEPVFFREDAWIDPPKDWSKNVVQGAGYDLTEGEGLRIWMECLARRPNTEGVEVRDRPGDRYGDPVLVKPRLGQGTFRMAVVDAYGRACAVSAEHSLPVLDAAHIKPYRDGGQHAIKNGLLLRTDIHRLFDKGYVTVTPDHRFRVSRRLKDEYSNGRSYYGFDDKPVQLPSRPDMSPDKELLEWHSGEIFLG